MEHGDKLSCIKADPKETLIVGCGYTVDRHNLSGSVVLQEKPGATYPTKLFELVVGEPFRGGDTARYTQVEGTLDLRTGGTYTIGEVLPGGLLKLKERPNVAYDPDFF